MLHRVIRKLDLLAKEKGVKRSLNFLLLEISNKLQLAHVWGQPTFIYIEPTTYCNSKCVMCWRTAIHKDGSVEKPRHMNFHDFKRIMLKLPYCNTIWLQGQGGEPLLNPDLLKMIKFCKERKIFTGFTTNATILSEKVGRNLILSGLDMIYFSIDSANTETFEKIRVGSKFSTVIKNVIRFVELKDELKSAVPEVKALTLVSKENVLELPHLLNLLKSVGIKKVIMHGLRRGILLHPVPPEQLNLLPRYKRYGASIGLEVELLFHNLPPLSGKKRIKCWKLWKSMYITVDGWVTPCCSIPYEKILTYGNILKQDFKEIWNDDLYQRSRRRLRNDPLDYPCKVCQWTH